MITKKLENEEREAWYSSMHTEYAYGPVHELTKKHYSLEAVEEKSMGTYRSTTRF